MFPDVRFEATFLRAALLSGLVREADASAWADALLANTAELQGQLAEVALAPIELTAMREALAPLACATVANELEVALLAFMSLDPTVAELATPDQLRVLAVMRRENLLSNATAGAAKDFEDRQVLASVGMRGEVAPSSAELAAWLRTVRPTVYFRMSFDRDDEQAAFLAALSRVVVRERRSLAMRPAGDIRAWSIGRATAERGCLVLSESLWIATAQAFSPLPMGSRIPYVGLPADAAVVLDAASASAMGADEAAALLAV